MATPLQIRALTLDDLESFLAASVRGFSMPHNVERSDALITPIKRGYAFGADHPHDRGQLAATSIGYEFAMGVPGGKVVPTHGLSDVTVRPDVTRRGLMSAMLAEQFAKARHDGFAWSALWAAEPGIYGRFGYGPAVPVMSGTLTAKLPSTSRDGFEFIMLDAERVDPQRIHDLQARVATAHAGTIVFPAEQVGHRLARPIRDSLSVEGGRVVLAVRNGTDVGYSIFTRDGSTVSSSIIGVDGAALCAMGSWLGQIDSASSVQVRRMSPDSPLLWGTQGFAVRDGRSSMNQWVKLLDVAQALRDRTYTTDVDLTLHVLPAAADPAAHPITVHIEGAAGQQVTVEDVASDPDITIDEGALAYMMLGALRPQAAVAQEGVREHTDGAALAWARACVSEIMPAPSEFF